MKNLLFLLTLVSVMFIGCDGKDRVHLSNTEVLKEHKLLDSFSEKVEFIPESHVEINTDTILNNGFRVKIRYHRHIKEYVSLEYNEDSIHHIKHYYDFVAKVTIYKGSEEIFKKDIYKRSLEKHSVYFVKKVQNLIMNPSYIDYERSLKKDEVVIVFPLCTTDTQDCLFYELIVNKNGSFEYKLIENNNNFYH